MAEEKAAATPPSDGGKGSGGKPIVLYALVVLNMLVVIGVGALVFMKSKQDAAQTKAIDAAANGMAGGEHAAPGEHGEKAAGGEHGGAAEGEDFVGRTIPMETFLVNLSGNRGNKVVKVNMELEVEGERIADEIDKRKPQIRDIIIILLSSKTYAQVQSAEGKEFLREEIRDTVNSFLTKGKIKRVLFTEFLVN